MRSRAIKVDYLARVEGEGGINIKIRGREVTDVKFRIFEPPRFFEAFLRGRSYTEVPDITARICGICPIAYQMSSIHAIEDACGVAVSGQLRALRRLIYCGEWIESHVLHVSMLHAPDFLGYADVLQMAQDHRPVVEKVLQLKKVGNELVALLGGREIHPINVRVGGFYRVPTKSQLAPIAERLRWGRDAAVDLVRWVATLTMPDFERDYDFVSLVHPQEYPLNEGRLVSSRGLDVAVQQYDDHFQEEHVKHSNALQSVHKERGPYFVGPLARYNLNYKMLTPLAAELAAEAGLGVVCRNPFKSIIVRAVETLYACEEALRIIEQYEAPERPSVDVPPRAGVGYGCTEAPRGILFHRYRIDDRGTVLDAKIVPPTSQNLRTIEADLKGYVEKYVDMNQEQLTWQCEQAVRNYDPCISCATHFLSVRIDRE